jgi:hypothetical protein
MGLIRALKFLKIPMDIPEGCENASDNPKPDWDVPDYL